MKCKTCGVEYNDTDRFCGICGTPNPNFEVNPPFYSTETEHVITEPNKLNEETEEKNGTNAESAERENSADFPDPTAVTNVPDISTATFGGDRKAVTEAPRSDFSRITPPAADNVIKDTESGSEEVTNGAGTDCTPFTSVQEEGLGKKADFEFKAASNSSDASTVPNVPNAPNVPNTSNAPKKQKKSKLQKEKRVCSLSAVVVCIIVILFLSVALGAVSGLYLGEKKRGMNMRNGSVLPDRSYSYTNNHLNCG